MIFKIVIYGDPVLREFAGEVCEFNGEIKDLAHNMVETLDYATGLGLAAPQVGISKRVIVVKFPVEGAEIDNDYSVLINPTLTISGENLIMEEGCLSFPEIFAEIPRRKFTEVEAFNISGEPVSGSYEELNARILQHEVDHLNGILFIDRMSKHTRKAIDSKLNELLKVSNKG